MAPQPTRLLVPPGAPRPERARAPSRTEVLPLVGGGAAAAAAGLGMVVLRATLQVRSIPERILEWLLLFVPLDLFEAGLRRFGFDAKRYGLYAAIAATLALLAALGAFILRRRWPPLSIVALALGLWLFTMVVIMPLTSAGFFAIALIHGTKAAVGGYLAVALTYAGALIAAGALLPGVDALPARAGHGGSPGLARAEQYGPRRAALPALAGAGAAYLATFAAVRWGPQDRLTSIIVRDPQEPVPSGGVDSPNAHPSSLGTPQPASPARPAGSQADRAGLGAPAPAGSNEPPPPRRIVRDKDGAALPVGRRPGQLAEPLTSNDDFYIVTKNAGGDPLLDVREWRLRIDGDVQRPVEVDYASLRRLPAVEITKTLECISNFVNKCELAPFGCDLISTARWKGARVSDVLALAGGIKTDVVSLATFAADEYTTALPIEAALAPETLLVYEMNGTVLPREHGYPLRMLVPGRYGMKNAKWIVALRVMRREFVDWYGQRNWSRQAIVKTMTRIDLPAPGATLPPGQHRIAGIAYAGDRGVARVEYSADGGGTWNVAEFLEPPPGRDVWVRWQGQFSLAPAARLTLLARATDGAGAVQPEPFSLPQPDGGGGWHSLEVQALRA